MHSADLCHDPQRAEKCDGKGRFSSHCSELFKNPPKTSSGKEKREACPIVQLPSIQKHNRVKSALKSGEERGSSVPFYHRQAKEGSLSSPCVPDTHNGLCPAFSLHTGAM